MRSCVFILALLLAASVIANDETQTDWSGGPEPGPVTFWDDNFDETAGINWYDTSGEITLGVPEFIVDPSFDGAECVDARGAGVTATVSFDPSGDFLYMNPVSCYTFPAVGDSGTILKLDAATYRNQ